MHRHGYVTENIVTVVYHWRSSLHETSLPVKLHNFLYPSYRMKDVCIYYYNLYFSRVDLKSDHSMFCWELPVIREIMV